MPDWPHLPLAKLGLCLGCRERDLELSADCPESCILGGAVSDETTPLKPSAWAIAIAGTDGPS